MALLDEIRSKKPQLMALAERYGVSDIRIFGSVARREERADSDVDLLIDIRTGTDGFAVGGFQIAASKLLGREVHLSARRGYHYPEFKKMLFEDSLPL
jgi:predicted nucleotidyltransferase